MIRLLRPHQWVKNLFIFLPLFFVGQITEFHLFLNAAIAFIGFSLTASSIYVLNDLLDVKEDRLHPKKKFRPLASDLVSKKSAILLIVFFSLGGLIVMASLSVPALLFVLTYFILNIGYSLWLKHMAIVDITIIAIGFILRLFVGSFATGVHLSKWIVIMTFLLALFLALAKRRDDVLHFMNTGKKMRKVIDGYNLQMIDGAMMIMASVIIVSYLLYTTSIDVVNRINNEYLYLTTFFVILGIMRYLQLSLVEEKSGSPTKIVLKDKFVGIILIMWISSFAFMIYF